MYVVADLDTEEGLALVQYALTYLVRLTLSHIPSAMSDSHTVDYTGRQLTNIVCPQPCNNLCHSCLKQLEQQQELKAHRITFWLGSEQPAWGSGGSAVPAAGVTSARERKGPQALGGQIHCLT